MTTLTSTTGERHIIRVTLEGVKVTLVPLSDSCGIDAIMSYSVRYKLIPKNGNNSPWPDTDRLIPSAVEVAQMSKRIYRRKM